MFWTDWGKHAKIERADMDGKNRRVIISEGLQWPNGLTIDRPTNRIIWADAKMEVHKHMHKQAHKHMLTHTIALSLH